MSNEFEKMVESFFVGWPNTAAGINSAYPPHNTVKLDDETYLIEIAVAGIDKKDIDISVEKQTLSVIYNKPKEDFLPSAWQYIHKGISQRSFTKRFTMGEHLVVRKATFVNGLLQIELKLVIPEKLKPQKIKIEDDKSILFG